MDDEGKHRVQWEEKQTPGTLQGRRDGRAGREGLSSPRGKMPGAERAHVMEFAGWDKWPKVEVRGHVTQRNGSELGKWGRS